MYGLYLFAYLWRADQHDRRGISCWFASLINLRYGSRTNGLFLSEEEK